ncbi:MAG: TIGR01777 family protein [Candidatus Hydrogenedentes bacterium]|nr:TIGR01777 family protein [Candidatus Hydrogenedentota bacterium]
MKVLVSGASGLVGALLTAQLTAEQHQVYRLVRRQASNAHGEICWNIASQEIEQEKLEGIDAVIHLSGENVAGGYWTASRKRAILSSRVESTRLLCKTLLHLKRPPRAFVSASAIGYYGNQGATLLAEDAPMGTGFLADVCRQWERESAVLRDHGMRVVNMRIGIVLARQGGMLAQMRLPFQLGLGGVLGDGRQYMSWIDIDDAVRAFAFALTQSLHGPVNLVSPNPVTNREFTKTLGSVLRRPTVCAVPALVLRTLLRDMAREMFLTSTRAVPGQLLERGFAFQYPNLEDSLRRHLRP